MKTYATAEKVAEGFKAASERISSIEKESQVCFQETKEALGSLQKQLRLYAHSILDKSMQAGEYQGFWRNDEQAKEFGSLVLALAGRQCKDMGTIENPLGGAVVPTELSRVMIQKLGQYGKFRRNSLVVQMGSGNQKVPRVTTDLTIYCPDQGGEIQKSDVKADMVGLNTRKFACLTVINRELDEDSIIGLGEIVGLSITRSMAKREDEVGFMGDGTSEYFGMLGIIGAMLKIATDPSDIPGLIIGSGNTYAELTLDDFTNVVGLLPSEADDGAGWFMNKKFYYGTVYKLARAAGVANIFEILSNQKGRYLMGYPVEFIHCMPYAAANSQIVAILGDLKLGAYLGERRMLEIARSDEVLFGNDQIAIRGTERIDVAAHGVGDATEPGSIVALATAAS
ncbi:MAG: phage major capsid protein [Phycisphaerae bacterium]|nr:phage major capsid protein [Phycisphaerae bacterium]MDD5381271.1 phage major capsid protein [Phycisphaerae bacterium]